jgi:hypothetical protein
MGGPLHCTNDAMSHCPLCRQASLPAFPVRKLAELDAEDASDDECAPPSLTPM